LIWGCRRRLFHAH